MLPQRRRRQHRRSPTALAPAAAVSVRERGQPLQGQLVWPPCTLMPLVAQRITNLVERLLAADKTGQHRTSTFGRQALYAPCW
mmetsp:Transcript_115991/g.300701  ORF Transcript_115991/g.300701 Transcript_115991/m.300701 type:complete len:83 (+) Transcript_115991:395-643(+)